MPRETPAKARSEGGPATDLARARATIADEIDKLEDVLLELPRAVRKPTKA